MKKYMILGLLLGTVAMGSGCASHPPAPTSPAAQNPQVQQPASQTSPAPSSTTPTSPSNSTTPTTTATGKDVYDKNCSGCHGAGGAGGSAQALNTEKRSQTEVADITKNGKGSMPGFASTLSAADIQTVAQYVSTLKK